VKRSEPDAPALKRALERGELRLAYQPKIDLGASRIVGVEALARWQNEAGEEITPAFFVPLAEQSGLIDELTEWVCRTALKQWSVWRDQGMNFSVAINISALTLRDVGFPDFLQRTCQLAGVPCEQVIVELTESAAQHVVHLLDTLTRFRIKGFRVALDDFGTGYSSLLQLRQLPFTELKIDRSFTRDVTTAEDSRLIVRSIIDLAHALGLTAVAEGVEDEPTLKTLVELGCDNIQGYFLAVPMRGADVIPWVGEWAARAPRLLQEPQRRRA
jgi:EAL domain-containing protein (putative c-di-GMP-specific phosphodiesterase class I)